MNPQQYYQYQFAVPPGMQTVPGQTTVPYLATHPIAGGMHVAVPPPPPPSAFTALAPPKSVIAAAQKLPDPPASIVENSASSDKSLPSACNSMNVSEADAVEDKSIATVGASQVNLSGSTTTTTAVADATIPTPTALPPASHTPSMIGGVYAGAYIQQAVPQLASSVAASPTQYVMTPGAQASVPVAHGTKLMYVPYNYTAGAGSYYLPHTGAVQPTIVTDPATGKQYLLNSSYQLPVQMAATAGVKSPAQPYVMAPPQYYTGLQAQASPSLQPVYGRVQGIPNAGMSAVGAVPGVSPNYIGTSSSTPQVYYY